MYIYMYIYMYMSVHKRDNQTACNDGNETYKDIVLLKEGGPPGYSSIEAN